MNPFLFPIAAAPDEAQFERVWFSHKDVMPNTGRLRVGNEPCADAFAEAGGLRNMCRADQANEPHQQARVTDARCRQFSRIMHRVATVNAADPVSDREYLLRGAYDTEADAVKAAQQLIQSTSWWQWLPVVSRAGRFKNGPNSAKSL